MPIERTKEQMLEELEEYNRILKTSNEELKLYPGFCRIYQIWFAKYFTEANAPTLFDCYAPAGSSRTTDHYWFTMHYWEPRLVLVKDAAALLELQIMDIDLQTEANANAKS